MDSCVAKWTRWTRLENNEAWSALRNILSCSVTVTLWSFFQFIIWNTSFWFPRCTGWMECAEAPSGFTHMQGAFQMTKSCEPLTGRVLRWQRRLEGLGESIMTSEMQHISISNTSHRGMFWLGPLQTIPPWERVAATKEENNIPVFAFQSSHFSPTELILWERNLRATVSVPVIRVRPFWIYQAPCGACCFFNPN